MKRAFDIFFAMALALPAAFLAFACWLAIRADSPGGGIFRQVRVGQEGKAFVCYKLRTMYIETKDAPSHETPKSAVTRVGSFLRRYKLDELPQIWNVLSGEMSFVGPRPCLPSQTELIEARRALGVLSLRPGITGIAQVKGIDMSNPDRLAREDARYLTDNGVARDFSLMAATLFGSGRGDRTS